MVQKRDIVVAIILSLVTCGIYGIYWFIVMTDDVKTASGDTQLASGGVAFLLTLVLGNLAIRVVYEASMMMVGIWKNTKEINKKMK